MKPIIIESPFKATEETSEYDHRHYLDRCIRDSLMRGETPYASHKMLPDALDDSNEGERELGIEAGFCMSSLISNRAFYLDYGMSDGMLLASDKYGCKEKRYIGKNTNHVAPQKPLDSWVVEQFKIEGLWDGVVLAAKVLASTSKYGVKGWLKYSYETHVKKAIGHALHNGYDEESCLPSQAHTIARILMAMAVNSKGSI